MYVCRCAGMYGRYVSIYLYVMYVHTYLQVHMYACIRYSMTFVQVWRYSYEYVKQITIHYMHTEPDIAPYLHFLYVTTVLLCVDLSRFNEITCFDIKSVQVSVCFNALPQGTCLALMKNDCFGHLIYMRVYLVVCVCYVTILAATGPRLSSVRIDISRRNSLTARFPICQC